MSRVQSPREASAASYIGGQGYLLYHFRGTTRAVETAPHFHDEYVISLQLRGQETCRVGGELVDLSPGEFVLINPQQVHSAETGSVQDEPEFMTLYVEPGLVAELAASMGAPTSRPEFVTAHTGVRPELARKLKHVFEVAAEHAGHDAASQHAAIDAALHELLVAVFEAYSNLRIPMRRSTSRVGHRKVARALEYMRALPRGDGSRRPTTEELATIAGLSKFHFIREFERHVGMTPGAYLRMLRLTHATRLLRETQLRVSDIALNVGFADHPSFSRSFTRTMGMTPVAYRRIWAS